MNPHTLVTMRGPMDSGALDLSKLSNFEAGILVMSEINRAMPGMTWRQLAAGLDRPEAMGGWLTDLGHKVASVGRSVGGTVVDVVQKPGSMVMDAVRATGSTFGDAVRLMTDEKVMASMNSAYKTYTDGGGVAGFMGGNYMNMFSGGEGGEGGAQNAAMGIWDFITNLGAGAKAKTAQASIGGGIPGGILPWAVGGVVVFYLIARRR